MSLRLLRSFGSVTKQGEPITGLRRFGVPVGGAFDLPSLRAAQELAGTAEDGYEIALGTAEFEAIADCRVGVAGATAKIGQHLLASGERLTVEVDPSRGARAYVCVGDPRLETPLPVQAMVRPERLRILSGPQRSEVTFDADGEWRASNLMDRRGVRLDGPTQPHSFDMRSEPACVGALQITPDGTPILIGPDGPTIGGYPKVAVVVAADLWAVGQLVPGQVIRLEWA